MSRDSSDLSGLPWYSILLGYPVIGIWYWCADQTIVQRVLAARDETQARLGPLFCAAIKILPVFFFVLPGVICVALVQKGAFGGDAPRVAADTYTFLITHLLPTGLKGLVTAAMLAAAMQTCSAALNSTATLFAYDIFKRWRPGTTDHGLVVAGKITTVVATALAIVWSPLLSHYTTIFDGLVRLISYISPPITAVFLVGVFWKRASAKAAYITLVAGSILGALLFSIDFFGRPAGLWLAAQGFPGAQAWIGTLYDYALKDFMLTAFWLLLVCCAILAVFSMRFPEPLKMEARELVWEDWREPLRAPGSYRIVSAAVAVTFIVLYAIFR